MRGKTSGKPRKHIKKQKSYHSSSSEDEGGRDVGFAPVNLAESDEEAPLHVMNKEEKGPQDSIAKITKHKKVQATDAPSSSDDDITEGKTVTGKAQRKRKQHRELDDSDESDSDANSEASSDEGEDENEDADNQMSTRTSKPKSKRNDPTAFSTSISKILSTKLPTSVRHDPVLSRSVEASKARQEASNERLETKARAKLRADKQAALQKGRTTDVLGIERGIAGEVAEKEKALRKIAQKGVIQLFNAFRAAHVKAEEARKEERRKGTVGMGERERKINEVSKEGFLELIGGKKKLDVSAA